MSWKYVRQTETVDCDCDAYYGYYGSMRRLMILQQAHVKLAPVRWNSPLGLANKQGNEMKLAATKAKRGFEGDRLVCPSGPSRNSIS